MDTQIQNSRFLIASAFVWQQIAKAFNANKTSWIGLWLFLLVIVLAILAPFLSTHDPLEQNILQSLEGPSDAYLMGTDYFGRDIYSRLLYGARITLIIGITSTLIAMVIGSIIGVLSGYIGGRFDMLMMQLMDILLAFPSLILGLIIVAMLGPSMANLVIAIALTAVPPFARIARAPTIAIKEKEFIEAGRSLGYSDSRIMTVHIFPNIVAEVLVMGALWLAIAVRVEASLAFIGLGVKPPIPTWGGMIRQGFETILDSPWLTLWPCLAILILIFSLNLLGDGLRDAMDARMRSGT